MNKLFTATVLGGTGLVGSHLVDALLEDERYGKVIMISRRPLKKSHPKLQVLLVDFDHLEEHELDIVGDVLFSCLGTTIKKAGSKEQQYKVDYQYQYKIAECGLKNGIDNYILVSSAGANEESKVFYSRIKGELDTAVQKLGFKNVSIIRPSVLDGPRSEFRLGERIALVIMKLLGWIPGIRKYRPIHAKSVAVAMINAHVNSRNGVFELEQVHELSELD
jgi:uncharacterized protein YbjT (DUF2867 family)